VRYGLGVLATSFKFRLHRLGLIRTRIFRRRGQKLLPNYYQEMENTEAHAKKTLQSIK